MKIFQGLGAVFSMAVLACGSENLPASVDDLKVEFVSETTVSLSWTSPTNDPVEVDRYDIRYSGSSVNADVWSSSSRVKVIPPPAPSGVTQELTVFGLFPGVTYQMALRTVDSDGDASVLSNVVEFKTEARGSTIDYFPMERGRKWYYRTVGGSEQTWSVVESGEDGASLIRVTHSQTDVIADLRFERDARLATFLRSKLLQDGSCRVRGIGYSPPIMFIDPEVETDLFWEKDVTIGDCSGCGRCEYFEYVSHVSSMAFGFEEVSTPAGAFNCLKVDRGFFALGVGLVKSDNFFNTGDTSPVVLLAYPGQNN